VATVPFYASLTVPAGTPPDSPATVELKVVPGRVKLIRLYVPPGPRGEVSLWVLHQTRQLLPVPPGVYQWVDDDIIEVALDYPAAKNETLFTLCASSEFANFPHRIDLEILVDADEAVSNVETSGSLLDRLGDLLGF
jgi:hypothetical protein